MVGTRNGFSPVNDRVDGRVHLPRGCPIILDAATLSLFRDPPIKISETVVEKWIQIPFDSTMRVELYKEIVADDWCYVKPLPHAVGCRHIIARNLTCFYARRKSGAKAHSPGAGNHQKITLATAACRRFHSMIERSRLIVRVVGTPVDLIDDPSLRGRRNRGHREIGITAEFAQQRNLTIQTAPPAVWQRVIESPVSMNEAEDRAAISFPQKTMIVCEAFAVIANLLSESFTCLVVVMEMHFDISNT